MGGLTDEPMDRHSEIVTYRAMCMRLNKAVYTTASVAYGWAGAVMEVRSLFGLISHCVTDGPTDRPTDGPTDRVTYRVACTRLEPKEDIGGLSIV